LRIGLIMQVCITYSWNWVRHELRRSNNAHNRVHQSDQRSHSNHYSERSGSNIHQNNTYALTCPTNAYDHPIVYCGIMYINISFMIRSSCFTWMASFSHFTGFCLGNNDMEYERMQCHVHSRYSWCHPNCCRSLGSLSRIFRSRCGEERGIFCSVPAELGEL